MKIRKRIFFPFILLVLLAVILFLLYNAGTFLVKTDPLHKTDAIVMLMGSIPDRVLETSDQYQTWHAGHIIMVEESMGAYRELEKRGVHIISNMAQCSTALVKLGVPPDSITCLPGDASSTQMEAVIICKYINTHKTIKSITLVSSPDHTRRATMIFKKAFEKQYMPVMVYSCPSKYSSFTGKGWWKDKEGIQTVLMEYLKMLNFLVFEKWKL